MRDIFYPGKLTTEWFKGRHKPYFHPVRLFIVSALFLIAALGYQISEDNMDFDILKNAEKMNYEKSFIQKLDSLNQQIIKQYPNSANVQNALDSVYINMPVYGNSEYRDSINLGNHLSLANGLVNFSDQKNQKISTEDFVNLTTEQVANKYEIKGFLNRLLFQQKLKLFKDQGSFGPFLLGNTLWVGLLMMPFLALILKLLYFRHDYFYVEHLIFSFHIHAFAFFSFALTSLLAMFLNMNAGLALLTLLVFVIYTYLSLSKVYQQSHLKTSMKLFFIFFMYIILISLFTGLGILISMAIF